MKLPEEWTAEASRILKSELKRRGVKYSELTDRLAQIGVHENERNVRNKVSRGSFSAVFLLQCLRAIGSEQLRLD
ncbi:DUF6471 domain-containing protein [Mesorhizobium sp. LHD-90]|uniref:DUF6471 domain-containing protein n=1 Tax=Mesorhizobium sp. LHD-90 TaxID=3071414 RepID=UPI0027E07F3C|nr:DUF6471 domain-containing protein [Mesorhizobium sp. LHD-90]MDQ6438170.1 DUF6471 domain-containing protein [Mesorhizobium sp. LHD-90]